MATKLNRMVLLGTAMGIPLFFAPDIVFEPYNLPKLVLLIFGVGLGLAFVEFRASDRVHLAVPAAALVLPLAVAWIWSPYKEWALLGQYARFNGLLPYALVALLGILMANAFRGRAHLLAWGLTVAGGIVGTYAFVQALGLDPFWSPGGPGSGDYPPSSIGHFNFLGGFLGICLPLSIYMWSRGGRYRLWGAWSTVAIAVGLLLANSQGGLMAGLAGTSIIAGSLLGERYRSAKRAGLVGAALVGLLVVAAVLASSYLPRTELLGGTIRQRARLWTTALEMGADSPVVGRGPGSYSVEGVRYRSLGAILAEPDTSFDEPHSVPLSFWANAGVIGALGFLVFAGWIIRTGLRIRSPDHLSTAFFAACVSYLVQSLVSIDELSLRSALWLAMAGMTMSIAPETEVFRPPDSKAQSSGIQSVARALAGIAIAAVAFYYAGRLLLADHHAESGAEHLTENEVAKGLLDLDRATSFRFEPHYLNLYAHSLGSAGLDRGSSGADLIQRMRNVYEYLEDFPDTSGILNEARLLHYWGRFEPGADIEAQHLLKRVQKLDPENPAIDIVLSEVLIDLGMTERARLSLERWASALDNQFADYWGALSIARLLDHQPAAADRALDEGLTIGPSSCRVLTARELIRHHQDPSLPLGAGTPLLLRFACGEGVYQFFLAHLPDVE